MALAVAELYLQERDQKITFGCPPELVPLGDNVPGVEVVSMKQYKNMTFGRSWDITDDKTCFAYERALQPHVDRNRPQIWAQKMGLKGAPQLKVYLTDRERLWARLWIKEQGLEGKFLLGLVPRSMSWSRDWQGWVKLLYLLRQQHPDIAPLIFMAGVSSWDGIEYATCGIPVYKRPIREALAILGQCDLVAGVDTGPMHSAVGLGIPTLWLFTHIDGQIRTQGYEQAEVIQRKDLECCPCWYEPQCHSPAYMLCKGITVDKVIERIIAHYQMERAVSAHDVKNIIEVTPQSGGGEKKRCSL